MNNNFMQLVQMMRQSGNPQQAMMNILQGSASSNPMAANLLTLAQGGDGAGIEQVARNMCQSQGKDFDKEFSAFKQMLGIR